ncbi:hypothetical protein [Paenibacillus sp. S150]|uniref:hypothetical protein n=1 Tax=Paenibacillus sp. S150 TaxID=2749826 RepID=UPI001C55FCAE|nr:hypothetical protein [Paenibacillus sp. S150]MBW4083539.1 hypothetical protein [Paenibacillus sp. S150]
MALSQSITLSNGLSVNEAYIRVDTVNGYKGGLDISVNSYVSQAAFTQGQGYIEQSLYHFIPSVEEGSENFIKQGYDYLKTLPEFESAIDVFE